MTKQDHQGHPGYEKTDAAAGATVRAGRYILATMFLTALVLVPMYRSLARRERAGQRPAATLLKPDARPAGPAFPRLVTSGAPVPPSRAQEDAFLTSWGWVEKDKGIARIPIDEAMKIVAGRGLPTFAAPAPGGGER
jgi:hypothetical protein